MFYSAFSSQILAMGPIFPYLHAGPWQLGPFRIHMFGLMVAIGILTGVYVIQYRAFKVGLNTLYSSEMVTWGLIGLFVGAHLFEIIFYQPHRIMEDPLILIRIWDGIASFGGLLGLLFTLWLYVKFRKISFWPYLDVVMWGGVHAWIFGRMGCSFAHDHPGKFTNSWFSVKWPINDPGQFYNFNHLPGRHDLGLYELLFTFVMITAIYAFNYRGKRFAGFTAALVFVMYAPVRFMMDFLRTADLTYLGLTPAQYVSFVMFLLGIAMFIYLPKIDEKRKALEKKEKKGKKLESQDNNKDEKPPKSDSKESSQKDKSKKSKGSPGSSKSKKSSVDNSKKKSEK